jgi:hypothetical protein
MKRSDAKIAWQSSMNRTYIIVPLSASAGITSEALSVVLGLRPTHIGRGYIKN